MNTDIKKKNSSEYIESMTNRFINFPAQIIYEIFRVIFKKYFETLDITKDNHVTCVTE